MEDSAAVLTRVLKEAARVVEDAGLPESLRPRAFDRVLEVLLAEAGADPKRPRAALLEPAEGGSDASAVRGEARDPLDLIAGRAGLPRDAAQEIYRFDRDQVSLVVGDRKIARSMSTGSRQITLLVAGGRQAAGFEEWTNLAHAREVCSVYNRLDPKNYAATIKAMSDVFNFHGQGVHREVRLTMPGWDEWADLVRRLTAAGHRTV